MKRFAERNPVAVGAVGVALSAAAVLITMNYSKIPFVDSSRRYSAYFAEAGGLVSGAAVQVSGLRVGQVSTVSLDAQRVRVTFTIDDSVHLGDRTEAAIKTKSLLGAKILSITPRGGGDLSGPIPLERTRSPYQLPDALGDLSVTISGLDTGQVSDSLHVLAETFADTPPAIKRAVDGVARFSGTLDRRDAQLRTLLANANKVTSVLSQRTDSVVGLIADANSLLLQLRSQSAELDQIAANISAVAQQIRGFIDENKATFKGAIEKLNGVLAIVDNRKHRIQQAIPLLNRYAMSLGESLSSGPFFKAYIANLLPGQFVQPFVDAAFSDLGLDPHTLAPSDRVDPQLGQPGTPPLPVPFPRTGQGGEPATTLPDAITGNPGDPRYPYREPLPAPPPGGPPPGPPAPPLDRNSVGTPPATVPTKVLAPGESQEPASVAPGGSAATHGGTP
ncbi:MCE family protein [Mycobacterium vicinigordonae]|uniref:MCE family protein n=1 Tax=Mycobacterium vicinigordonae TaxID=1719132 RepID=A0A7D6HN57_9MYCO|nr:MCE family protein [Mycobacterium vicinigordonae]QLL06371.1 MCE family protein [Mycobacterium vicinigordonae]